MCHKIPTPPPDRIENEQNSVSEIWDIHITDIKIESKLETTESIELYGGNDKQIVEHIDNANIGNKFLLLSLYVNKKQSNNSEFNVKNVVLKHKDEIINQADNSFLSNHKLSAFPKIDIKFGENQGYICFEISENVSLDDLKLITQYASLNIKKTSPKIVKDTNIPIKESILNEQWEIEQKILENFRLDLYTLERPYIILDPYGSCPLSALVIFETEKPAFISIKVHGKDEFTHIEHTFQEMNTLHQMPIIGLYAGYENTIEIIAKYGNLIEHTNIVKIITEDIHVSSSVPQIELVVSEPSKMQEGLTFLNGFGKYPTAVDVNGEIRWMLTDKVIEMFKRCKNGNLISMFEKFQSRISEYDLLGKVYRSYNTKLNIHHDFIELPNENFLILSHTLSEGYSADAILEMDRKTGKVARTLDLKNILDKSRFNKKGNIDWIHLNAVWYDERDNSLIVSGRHQGLFKISYPKGKLIWITSLDGNFKNVDNKMLTPVDNNNFKPPVSQHSPMIIPNQVGDFDVIDVILYDNNHTTLDMPDYDENKKYSRMVQYRIDEKNMTIDEIWSYGEERGYEYFTNQIGDADYLPNNNVLGTFGNREYMRILSKNTLTSATIIEVNKETSEVSYEIDVTYSNLQGVYRSERLSAYPKIWNFKLFTTKGEMNARNNYSKIQTKIKFEKVELPRLSNVKGFVVTEFNNEFDVLDIYGCQMMRGVDCTNYKMSLVFSSNSITKSISLKLMESLSAAPEANKIYNDNVNYRTSGFRVAIPYEQLEAELPKGTYNIYTMIEAEGRVECRKTVYYFNTSTWSLVEKKDLIEQHNSTANNLINEYQNNEYTLENPLIKINPYGNAPLSGIVLFRTEKPSKITIEIHGLRGGDDLSKTYEDYKIEHQIPIYGLYSLESTNVVLTAIYEDNSTEQYSFAVKCDALPDGFEKSVSGVDKANQNEMFRGLTFYTGVYDSAPSNDYFHGIDSNGDVRLLIGPHNVALTSGIEFLKNGNFLVCGDKASGLLYYKDSFFEMDFTGRIYNEYLLEKNHHDIVEGLNGNFFALGSSKNGHHLEDTIYEICPTTGDIIKTWDMNEYFPVELYNDDGERISTKYYGSKSEDWLHMNSLDQNKKTEEFLFSGRNHDAIVSMNYDGSINYIISDPSIKLPENLAKKRLTPISENFKWSYGQHDVKFLENGDILLFDNGFHRGREGENYVDVTSSYSRIVRYGVNRENMTIEQIEEFGEELGSEHLSMYLSGVQYLDENHYLINFGGIAKDSDGNATYSLQEAVNGTTSTIVIEVKNGEIIFKTSRICEGIGGNTYRAERYDPYYNDKQLDIDKISGRLGNLPVRNVIKKDEFEMSDKSLSVLSSSIIDNGVQLEIKLSLTDIDKKQDLKLYAVGEKETYSLYLGKSDFTIYKLVNINEFPDDKYRFYLEAGGSTSYLQIVWNK